LITEALLIGLIIGFLFYELFEISPGGVITPGYFALFVDQPFRLISTIVIAFIVFAIIEYLAKYLILYGKRKFLLSILIGFSIKILFDQIFYPMISINIELAVIGYLIPGLIANEMSRQSPIKTILGLGIVTSIVFLLLKIFY
jgi:poly-gamma-glutamate biosynthesis protein PgsC/CapC